MSPTISTKKTTEKRALKSRKAMEREKVIFYGIVAGCAATVLIHLVIQIVASVSASNKISLETRALKEQRLLKVFESDQNFQVELSIAEKAQVENLAAKNRAEEWRERNAHDPSFAKTDFETAMLTMSRIGKDQSISDEDALKQIVKLASPPRTGVAVSSVRKKGYRVEIAFAYDEVLDAHPEYKRYLPGVYMEVKRTAAGIIRDVFKYGGDRGVYEVLISCKQSVTVRGRDGKTRELRDMLVLSGKRGRDWGSMDRAEAEDACKVIHDYFKSVME